jgi:nitrile hydratase accessory protein
VFAEPWEAQAVALVVKLSEQGHFTWKEWPSALADELKAAADRGEPDDGSRYYRHWLAALERLVTVSKRLNSHVDEPVKHGNHTMILRVRESGARYCGSASVPRGGPHGAIRKAIHSSRRARANRRRRVLCKQK